MTERDPRSRFEDEGAPDLQDDTPEQWAEEPADRPVGVEEYGTTAEEQLEGEPLDRRLARERPETGVEADDPDGAYPAWSSEAEPAGRLVEEDEGAHPDTEKDAVAYDAGVDGGGYSAEEEAVRMEPE